MKFLGVPLEDVREARRLDGLHQVIRTEAYMEEHPPQAGLDIHGVKDVLLYAVIFVFGVAYLGAPLFLVASGAWLPVELPGSLGTVVGWVMFGMAVVSLPVLGVSKVGKLNAFLALHGPSRRALFLHRAREFVPRLLIGSMAWGGLMAGRLRFSGLQASDALFLSLAVALLPSALIALLALRSMRERNEGPGWWSTSRGVLLIGGSSTCIALMLFVAFRIALEPSSGSARAMALLSRIASLAPVVAAAASAILWWECLRAFERKDIAAGGRSEPSPQSRPERLSPSGAPGGAFPFPTRRPRSVLGARLRTLADSSWGVTRAIATIYGMFGLLIVFGFAWSIHGKGGIHHWFLVPLVLCLVPMGGMLHKERAWLLGMDLVAQRRHARNFVFAVQVPMFCVTGALCAVALGGGADLWALVALMAGLITFRVGTKGWEELARRSGWRSFPARIPIYLLAMGLLFSPMAGATWEFVAAALATAAGLSGIGLETHLVRERDLLDEMRGESKAA